MSMHKLLYFILLCVVSVLIAPMVLFGFAMAFGLACALLGASLFEQLLDRLVQKLDK